MKRIGERGAERSRPKGVMFSTTRPAPRLGARAPLVVGQSAIVRLVGGTPLCCIFLRALVRSRIVSACCGVHFLLSWFLHERCVRPCTIASPDHTSWRSRYAWTDAGFLGVVCWPWSGSLSTLLEFCPHFVESSRCRWRWMHVLNRVRTTKTRRACEALPCAQRRKSRVNICVVCRQ